MPTISDIIAGDDRFETLVIAVRNAGLTQTLSETREYTIFAPTDEAFAAMPADRVQKLLSEPVALRNILLFHVVEGEYMLPAIRELHELKSVSGHPIAIQVVKNMTYVDDAAIVEPDIDADNGVIHVIDQVMLPY